MASAQFEFTLVGGNCQQMNVSGRILVKGHGLQQDIVSALSLLDFLRHVDDLEDSFVDFEGIWIHVFANFTFKSLPVEGPDVLGGLIDRLLLLLSQNPTLEALEVDQTDGTLALASQNKGVGLFVLLIAPTDSALYVIFGLFDVGGTLDLHSFAQFLLVKFFFGHLLLVAPEVLDSESDSAQLDCIELLNLIVVLSSFVFEGPSD